MAYFIVLVVQVVQVVALPVCRPEAFPFSITR